MSEGLHVRELCIVGFPVLTILMEPSTYSVATTDHTMNQDFHYYLISNTTNLISSNRTGMFGCVPGASSSGRSQVQRAV